MNNNELKVGDLVEVYSSRFITVGGTPIDISQPMKAVKIGEVGVVLEFFRSFPSSSRAWVPVLFASTGETLLVRKEYLRQIPTSTDEEYPSNATV